MGLTMLLVRSAAVVAPSGPTQYTLCPLLKVLHKEHILRGRHLLPSIHPPSLICRRDRVGASGEGRWVDDSEMGFGRQQLECVGRMERVEHLATASCSAAFGVDGIE